MPYSLSPSSLSLLKECPRCFWLRFNKGIKRPDTIFPTLPNGMDRVLKAHFDSCRDNGTLPAELQQLEGITLFRDQALLDTWRNYRKGLRWTDASGNTIRGAVDNLLQKGSRLIVLDYKTRGFPLKDDTHTYSQNQLNIYNFLLRKNGYDTEDYSYLIFYHPKRVSAAGDVVFHRDLVKVPVSIGDAARLIAGALDTLASPMPESDPACGFCRWADAAAGAGDTGTG